MTHARDGGEATPSKFAITKALAEAEVKRKRAIRYSLVALLLPLAVGAGLLAYTFYQVNRNLNDLNKLRADKQVLKGEVEELLRKKNQAQADYDALHQAVEDASRKGESAKAVVEQAQQAAANPSTAAVTPRVFIQFNSDGQNDKVREVSDALRRLNFVVPPSEKVSAASAPQTTEVRYYLDGDKDSASAVVGILSRAGLNDAKARQLRGKVRPGTLEVWFSSPDQ